VLLCTHDARTALALEEKKRWEKSWNEWFLRNSSEGSDPESDLLTGRIKVRNSRGRREPRPGTPRRLSDAQVEQQFAYLVQREPPLLVFEATD
jgi:hypothetical protein